jgi:hypothetical protein
MKKLIGRGKIKNNNNKGTFKGGYKGVVKLVEKVAFFFLLENEKKN